MRYKILLAFMVCLAVAACVPTQTAEPVDISPAAPTSTAFSNATVSLSPIPQITLRPRPVQTTTPTQTEIPQISNEARSYIDQALDLIQSQALNRNQIDWVRMREAVYNLAQAAQTLEDTYQAIQYALTSLGDGYSYLISANEVQRLLRGDLDVNLQPPQGRILEEGSLAYLGLPGIMGSIQANEDYAIDLQRLIVELDASSPCGWVVDLRLNYGGNVWPVLTGIGPVLGEGLVGSFLYPDGAQHLVYYTFGRALLDDEVQLGIEDHIAYQLQVALPLVAVLVDGGTMGTGEVLVVAFMGRGNARSFGQDTAGLASVNQTFVLSDGAWLQLATALVTDRGGRLFDGPIPPDEYTSPVTEPADNTLQAAVDWLLQQPECAGR